ncbi:MAG TPA: hypothetical protein VKY74_21040 [Chloroflexia bacterium]|nr:hypothetical protein [Chloroflexia bacterium]
MDPVPGSPNTESGTDAAAVILVVVVLLVLVLLVLWMSGAFATPPLHSAP